MKLKDLVVDNQPYQDLLKEYEKKVKTLDGIIDRNDFIKEEIVRIKTVYVQPLKVSMTADSDFKIVSSFDYTKYTKNGYEWLSSGYDVEVETIVKNARQGTNHRIYDEALFEKSVIHALQRGVGLVLYEQFLKKELDSTISTLVMKEVFVTYSWDSPEHQEKVIGFTEYLRQEGFHAEMDVKLSQEESAINFIKMMHKSIKIYKRIVIVLSKGYKEKAEVFEKGVGVEYGLILADIDENPKKIYTCYYGTNE